MRFKRPDTIPLRCDIRLRSRHQAETRLVLGRCSEGVYLTGVKCHGHLVGEKHASIGEGIEGYRMPNHEAVLRAIIVRKLSLEQVEWDFEGFRLAVLHVVECITASEQ